MIVRRYTGSSMEKIREVILRELGDGAVIVNSSKQVKRSAVPGLGKTSYEVTAALEDTIDADTVTSKAIPPEALKELLELQGRQYRGVRTSMKLIDEKLASMDTWMARIAQGVSDSCPEFLRNLHDAWRQRVQEAVAARTNADTDDPAAYHDVLAGMIKTAAAPPFAKQRTRRGTPQVFVLIGPTGVGKTTSLAKLAARSVLHRNLKGALITIDTFRIGATDQLKEYAALLGLRLSVAFSPDELARAIDNLADKDVVFVDTPGRSQFDAAGIAETKACLEGLDDVTVVLTVPAGIREDDAVSIYESYRVLDPAAIVITKTDEASRCDGLSRLLDISGLPVMCVTDGQRVPEDIHPASPALIASLVIPAATTRTDVKMGAPHADSR